MSRPARFCPLCDAHVDAAVCPTDGVATVRADLDTVEAVDPALGRVYAGRYRVERLLGEGGMGRVYAATQLSIEREVALKLLKPGRAVDGHYVRRFYREARAATRLSSPHVVQVHDFGVDDDTRTPFIAMELLGGQTLTRHLAAHGPLSLSDAAALLAPVARALTEAEAAGVVHRDLKPDNIVVEQPEGGPPRVKVADFGIAKELDREDTQTLTAEGATLGTPAYMAPEQVDGAEVDHRADLYALGCILHEALLGERIFGAQGRANQMLDHLLQPAPPLPPVLPTGEATPHALRDLHARLLAKEPERRPSNAEEVLPLLELLARGERPPEPEPEPEPAAPPAPKARSRWRRAWLALVIALGGAGAATLAISSPWDNADPAGGVDARAIGEPPPGDELQAPAPPTPEQPRIADQPPRQSLVPLELPPTLRGVAVRGAAGVVVLRRRDRPGPARITGDPRRVELEVSGERLTVSISDAEGGQSDAGALRVVVEVPGFEQLKVSGSVTVEGEGALRGEALSVRLTGSASVQLQVAVDSLTSTLRGNSTLRLSGTSERHDARIGGSTKLDAGALAAQVVSLNTEGAGDATVHAADQLDLVHESAGDVVYLGAPAKVNRSGEGLGAVRAAADELAQPR